MPRQLSRPIDLLKKLPQNLEAEKSFLGSILMDNTILDRETLTAEDFSLDAHQKIYQTMLDLWKDRFPVDPVILSATLEEKGWTILTGGYPYLEELTFIVPTAENAHHYARLLQEKTAARKALFDGDKLSRAGQSGDHDDIIRVRMEIAGGKEDEMIQWIDGADICRNPVEPFQWLTDGLFPRYGAGTVDGPPESGKSSLIMSHATHIANGGGPWFGQETIDGPVVVLGGEKSSVKVWRRDFERLGKVTRPGMFFIPDLRDPLFEWNRQAGKWLRTRAYSEVLKGIRRIKPVLVVGDTIMRITAGIEEINNTQQAYLGKELEEFAKEANCLFLIIGHTNQASTKESLSWRLHYTARAGGNGLPGVMRYCFAVTRLYESDAKTTGIPEDNLKFKKLLACGVSKGNELPYRAWSDVSPTYFEIRPDGQLMKLDKELVKIGDNRECLQEEVRNGYQDPLADWR